MTYALQIDGGVLGLQTAVKAIFEIRRASGVGNFVIIPEYTEIEVDLVLGEGEVFLTPNTVGSIYQCKFVRADDVTVGQFFFEMPSTNVMLSTLKKITAWPNELISNDELNEKIEDHKDDLANPHQVTAEQVGLGSVDNTSDVDKPISTLTQVAISDLRAESELGDATLAGQVQIERDEREADVTALDAAIDVLANGAARAYLTYAALDADKATLPTNSFARVTNDPTPANNWLWQWNGTVLTKSARDDLAQANAYVDANRLFKPFVLAAAADFNALIVEGRTVVPTNVIAAACTNRPSATAGVLDVALIGSGVLQVYRVFEFDLAYERQKLSDTTWTDWVQSASKDMVDMSAANTLQSAQDYVDATNGIAFVGKTTASAINARFHKAVKTVALRGEHTDRLITLAAFSYTAGNLSVILARPDSLSEVMASASNTKYVANFSGAVTFAGVQKLSLSTFGSVGIAAEISGYIIIDFDALLSNDLLSANYTASDRVLNQNEIINLNAEYAVIKPLQTGVTANTTAITANALAAKKYTEISSGILFTNESGTAVTINTRFNTAVKSLALKGNWRGGVITVTAVGYTEGVFSLTIAKASSLSEAMSPTNSKVVARFNGAITFAGVQTLSLTPYANLAENISGEITIDFDALLSTDTISTTYTASEREIKSRNIVDLNGYAALSDARDEFNIVVGSDAKNLKLNAAIAEIVFFKPLPANNLILSGLFYSAGNTLNLQIFESVDKVTKGTLWAQGTCTYEAGASTALVIFDQGYATIRLNQYFPDNVGAAVLGDNATYTTRGINKAKVTRTMLDSKVFQRYPSQFVDNGTYHLPSDYLARGFKLYIKGTIADTDYYLLNVLNWSLTSGKYRLTYQIKKMTAVDQAVTGGLAVYNGFVEFDTLDAIKGQITINAVQINSHPLPAEIDLDLDVLKYRTDNNNIYSPYVFNKSGSTYALNGFDVSKLRTSSTKRFVSSGGLAKYPTLKDAVAVGEKGVFAVGGNLFKTTKATLAAKSDLICVNSPPKSLARKSKTKSFDFYYKNVKTRLEIIGAADEFYFVNSTSIIKVPNAMRQAWTIVASAAAADVVVFDVTKGLYYSIPNYTELFTAVTLGVDSIFQARITYDDELFIIAVVGGNKSILFTENEQTNLRSFAFNGGTAATKYTFGAGVNVVKDWSFTHHKNVMFVADYDLGVGGTRGTTGGQKCYVSTDNGYTFTKCFDFTGSDWSNITNAANITAFGASQAHIHSVTYDPKQNVVWIITGDGAVSYDNSSIFWSRDLGQTWTHKRSTIADDGARTQHVIGLPFDGCMTFGSDASNLNGVAAITYDGDAMLQERIKNYASKSDLLCFARSVWARGSSKVKYMSFGKNSDKTADPDAQSFVIASANGYQWETVWIDNNAAIYGNVFCYDDKDGNVYITLDGSGAYKERVLMISVDYS